MAFPAVLVVLAHPDDESLACGGTIARLADAGCRVVLLCASRGERGAPTGPQRHDEIGDRRVDELRRAAAVLGISDVILLDLPDGDLRWAAVAELNAFILLAIRRVDPAAVITFGEDGLYWHADHIAVHERVTTAVRSLGTLAPALYYVTMPRGGMRAIVDLAAARGWTPPPKGFWSLTPDAFGLHAEAPTLVVDVTPWAGRKLDAIRCHRSQLADNDPFETLGKDDARRFLGAEHLQRADAGNRTDAVLEPLLS